MKTNIAATAAQADLVTLSVYAEPALQAVAELALKAWNEVLKGRVELRPSFASKGSGPFRQAILIRFGMVDRTNQADRVAQCCHFDRPLTDGGKLRFWDITLASDTTWSITRWQRFWGTGRENALAALLHEIGHVFGFPHSATNHHVMAAQLGSTVISSEEAAGLRRFFDAREV